MKTLQLLILSFALVVTPMLQTGCPNTPTRQVIAVQTLKSLGQAGQEVLGLSGKLFNDGIITGQQARAVLDFYDKTWIKAYDAAVTAALADTNAVAVVSLIKLAKELFSMLPAKYHTAAMQSVVSTPTP